VPRATEGQSPDDDEVTERANAFVELGNLLAESWVRAGCSNFRQLSWCDPWSGIALALLDFSTPPSAWDRSVIDKGVTESGARLLEIGEGFETESGGWTVPLLLHVPDSHNPYLARPKRRHKPARRRPARERIDPDREGPDLLRDWRLPIDRLEPLDIEPDDPD
jgi:hypothetical protein